MGASTVICTTVGTPILPIVMALPRLSGDVATEGAYTGADGSARKGPPSDERTDKSTSARSDCGSAQCALLHRTHVGA